MSVTLGQRAISFFKSTVIGGLFVLGPIVLLLVIVAKAVEVVYSVLKDVFELSPVKSAGGISLALAIGIVAIVLLCFLAGLVARTTMTKRLVHWIESMILSNMPGYSLMKGVGESLVGGEGRDGREAVMVRFEASSMIGFRMDRFPDGRSLVFVPGVPNAFTGTLHIVEASRVEPLGVPIRTALDCLKRLGAESAKVLSLKSSDHLGGTAAVGNSALS